MTDDSSVTQKLTLENRKVNQHKVAFLRDFEHLRGRHKVESMFPDYKYVRARNKQQEAIRRFEDALRPWEFYGLRREEWTFETLQGLFPEA